MDEKRKTSLQVLKKAIENGTQRCNACQFYLDERVECWKKCFPEGCNQWQLSCPLKEAFREHGIEPPKHL